MLAIADEESPALDLFRLRDIGPDVVLSAGDLHHGYVEYVAGITDAPLVWVPGNHDPEPPACRLNRQGLWIESGRVAEDPRPRGGLLADGAIVEAAGLRIAGLGGCVRYRPGPNQYTQREYHRRVRRLVRAARKTGPVDVLLTHAPPAGLGDEDDAPHQGIEALHDLLAALQPRWHLHGHIHPHGHPRPDRQVGETIIRNVIPFDVLEIQP